MERAKSTTNNNNSNDKGNSDNNGCNFRYWCFLPALFGIIAIICGGAGTVYCQTLSFGSGGDSDDVLYVGIFQFRSPNGPPYECISYDELFSTGGNIFDTKWKVVKVFSVLALILGGLLTFVVTLIPCGGCFRQKYWKCAGYMYLLMVTTFQGLSLLLLNSNACSSSTNPAALFYLDTTNTSTNGNDTSCEWAAGMKLIVVAIIFYALAGITILVLPESALDPPGYNNGISNRPTHVQVTYQRTINPEDGTTIVEKIGQTTSENR